MDKIQPEKCNHKINSTTSSITIMPGRKTFTYPEHVFGICKHCGKSFHYIKKEDGKLILYKEVKERQDVNN